MQDSGYKSKKQKKNKKNKKQTHTQKKPKKEKKNKNKQTNKKTKERDMACDLKNVKLIVAFIIVVFGTGSKNTRFKISNSKKKLVRLHDGVAGVFEDTK